MIILFNWAVFRFHVKFQGCSGPLHLDVGPTVSPPGGAIGSTWSPGIFMHFPKRNEELPETQQGTVAWRIIP